MRWPAGRTREGSSMISPTTTEALSRIGALYVIEDEIRGKPADLRLSVRQTRARPLLDELRRSIERAQRSLSAKSEASAAERALRAVALGRKNFLFAGSDCGGVRAAP